MRKRIFLILVFLLVPNCSSQDDEPAENIEGTESSPKMIKIGEIKLNICVDIITNITTITKEKLSHSKHRKFMLRIVQLTISLEYSVIFIQ